MKAGQIFDCDKQAVIYHLSELSQYGQTKGQSMQ